MNPAVRLLRCYCGVAAVWAAIGLGAWGCSRSSGTKPETPEPPPQSPGKIDIRLTATADGNRCSGSPGSLKFRVIQLSDTSMGSCRQLADCWGNENYKLGGTVLGDMLTETIAPGATWEQEIEPRVGVKAVLVLGNFCNPNAVWYLPFPTTRKNLKIHLSVGPNGFKDLGG